MLTKGEEKKSSHSLNMRILGHFLSCQVAGTKLQEEAKMLSNPWKVNKSTISIRIKKGTEDNVFFSFQQGKLDLFDLTQKLGSIIYVFLFRHFILNDYVPDKTEQLKERRTMALTRVQKSFLQTLLCFIFLSY